MKRIATSILAVGAAVAGDVALAAPGPLYGNVVSSTPVVAQVAVPRQQCVDVPGTVRAQPSGLGGLVGGALGGLAGNQIGAGAGRAVATGIGAIAGIVAGSNIEAANAPSVPVTTTQCRYVQASESRIVGYDVVYELNGQRYTTRTQQDPGPRIALAVQPATGPGASYGGSAYPDSSSDAPAYAGSPYDAPPPDASAAPYAAPPPYPAPAPVYAAPYPTPYGYYAPYPAYGYYGPAVVVRGRWRFH